ncbi:MAG: glycosyltransferase [Proteobacteria bacterium]|nr:glycosyltransferase [Pseudomonadota bacterium]MBU1450848.1 glycosyltransferase [Pseudomonadota bacterium]MBU2470049.1 glycosyltransferase [Pseudomonadota bacterium]
MHFTFDREYIDRHRCRVAMVVANRVIGDSRVIKTAQTVRKMGYDLTLFGMGPSPEAGKITGFPFNIVLLPNPKHDMLQNSQLASGQDIVHWEDFIESFAKDLAEHLGRIKPDILHTHDMLGLAAGAKLKEHHTSRPYRWIHDIHEYVKGLTDLPEHTRDYFYAVEKQHLKDPDYLTCVSPSLNRLLKQEQGLDREPALVLNTPRLSDFDPLAPLDIRKALGLGPNTPLLVYSGGVKPIRGLESLIEALPHLDRQVHLAVITNLPDYKLDSLHQIIKRLSLESRVHFHPYVPSMQVTSFLSSGTLGIHPILHYPNAAIALPNKLFEYMHAGLPVVVSDNPTMAEFVRRRDLGTVFRAGDPRSLAEAIGQALARLEQDPQWPARIRALAPDYCWEAQEEVIAGIYRQATPKTKAQAVPKARPRVLHLPVGGAGQPGALARALRLHGVQASCLLNGLNKYNFPSDLHFEKFMGSKDPGEDMARFEKLAQEHDVFHYHARPLYYPKRLKGFPSGLDLILLRAAGKKVLFHFRGTEIRMASIFKQGSPYHYADELPQALQEAYPEEAQQDFLEFAAGVCHGVLVVDPELQTYAPQAMIVPRVVDTTQWTPADADPSGPLRIVHAPSNRLFKGTDYVIQAVEKLKAQGYEVELTLVEKMSHQQAMEAYRRAEVVVDQLRIGWYGVLAVEAMALGKAVVSFVRDDLKHHLPHPAPLALANPDNVYEVLAGLASDRNLVRELGRRGRAYAQEHHDAVKVSETLLHLYQSLDRQLDAPALWRWMDPDLAAKDKALKKKAVAAKRKQGALIRLRAAIQANRRLFFEEARQGGWGPALGKAQRKIRRKLFP